MKTLEQTKSEVFALEIWTIHEDLDEVINEVARRYAKEVAQQTIKNVCKNYDKKTDVGQANIAVISLESNIPEI